MNRRSRKALLLGKKPGRMPTAKGVRSTAVNCYRELLRKWFTSERKYQESIKAFWG